MFREDYFKHKIIWAELARSGNSFVFDTDKYMSLAGTFNLILQGEDKQQFSFKYLVSFLNNPLTLFSLENVYSKLDDTGWQWKKEPFLKIPIPRAEIQVQKRIESFYEEAITTNFSIDAIASLDNEIFNYYSLSSDEIRYLFKRLKVFSKEEKFFT